MTRSRGAAVDQRGVDAVGEQGDEPIGVAEALAQHIIGRREIAGPDIDFGMVAQAVERIAGKGAGDEDARAIGHAVILMGVGGPRARSHRCACPRRRQMMEDRRWKIEGACDWR